MLGYEDALAIIQAAPKGEFTLAKYEGGVADQVYLKQWVTDLAVRVYGVDPHVFDAPTLGSTTLLRDLVHRALYQTSNPKDFSTEIVPSPDFLGYQDVAQSFRYPAHGLCSQMAWQLWEVYQSFGYSTTDLATINGNVDNYTDSHVMVEVYAEDLGKEIVQDATYNFLYKYDGSVLSFSEARTLHNDPAMVFESTGNYRDYYLTHEAQDGPSASLQDYIRDQYLSTLAWWWGDSTNDYSIWNIFSDHPAHTPRNSSPGGAIGLGELDARIAALQPGEGTQALVDQLGHDGFYASGFTVLDGQGAEHGWVTVKQGDGGYVSVSLNDDPTLIGALDELEREAVTGVGPNEGTDLSLLLGSKSVYGTWFSFDPAETTPRLISSYGTDFADSLQGGSNEDRLLGFDGNDVLNGGAGADYMQGGRGDDVYFVDTAKDRISEAPNEGYDTVIATTDYALPDGSSVELLRTTGSSSAYSINLTGNEFANTLVGNAAANVLDGRGGADQMWGYGGDDIYHVDNVDDLVVERPGEGRDWVIVDAVGSYGLTAGSEVELLSTIASSTTFSVDLAGNELNNTIVGNAASNVINGRGGADVMWGYGGDDFYYVDNPNDVVVELAGDGYDTIYTTVSLALAPGNEIEVLRTLGSSTAHEVDLTGNEFNNTIIGNAAANVINGGAGADVMWGYGGDDVYYVDNEKDVVVALPGNGFDTIYASVNYTLTPGNEVEQLLTPGSATTYAINLTGNELANTVVGNDGVNVLDGGAGDDLIWGYAGNDVLIGGVGKDVLNGGDGADRFVFRQASDSATGTASRDVIQDFTPGVDKIDLSALQISQLHFAGSESLDSFGVRFGWSDGVTLVDIDVNGDRSSDMQIELTGQLLLSTNDFVFA